MQKATIEDVARETGVSTFTVSRALRGKDHVAEKTRQKVLQAAKTLNYTASPSAAALASGQTRRVALLFRERMGGWFPGELLDGMYDVLSPARYDLMVYRAGNIEGRSSFFTNLPANKNADALVMAGFSATQEEEKALKAMGMPMIAVNSSSTSYCQGAVTIDDEAAGATAVRYLSALGHTHLCYIGRTDPLIGSAWGYDLRSRGYRNEVAKLKLHDCGMLAVDPALPHSVKQTVARVLALDTKPTALCVWSDYYALAVIHELTKTGLQVPDDVSILSFDGSDIAVINEISTMSQPAREIGRLAAQKALDLIAGIELDEVTTLVPTILEPGITTRSILCNKTS